MHTGQRAADVELHHLVVAFSYWILLSAGRNVVHHLVRQGRKPLLCNASGNSELIQLDVHGNTTQHVNHRMSLQSIHQQPYLPSRNKTSIRVADACITFCRYLVPDGAAHLFH